MGLGLLCQSQSPRPPAFLANASVLAAKPWASVRKPWRLAAVFTELSLVRSSAADATSTSTICSSWRLAWASIRANWCKDYGHRTTNPQPSHARFAA